jgi:hypothetical protein
MTKKKLSATSNLKTFTLLHTLHPFLSSSRLAPLLSDNRLYHSEIPTIHSNRPTM